MSNSFNDQLSRMKALMTYGSVNEDAKHISSYNIEYKAQAADGKYYGIIRENSKYYVKVAAPGKETIAESYQYIGGIQNKANYEYNSYANALKQFELKLGSINEAYDENRRVNVEALDPYKKEDLVIEGTEKMKNELARQRQIMRNASVIMNEATEIGSTPFKTQPESEHDNSGDEDTPFTEKGRYEEDRGAIKFDGGDPEKHSATFGPDSKDVYAPGDDAKKVTVPDSVASENPKGAKSVKMNESMGECGNAGLFSEEGEEDFDVENEPVDTDGLDSVEPEELDDEPEMEGEPEMEDELGDEELKDEDEFGEEDLDDEDFEDEDNDEFDFDDEEDEFDDDAEDEDFEEDEDDFDDEEDFDDAEDAVEDTDIDLDDEVETAGDDELEDEFDEEDPEIELDENIVKKFRGLVRESINEMFGDMAPEEEEAVDEEEFDDEEEPIEESKAAKMNSIVESVVNDILNEDELHVFGDHPGYRKKPFTLPRTGEDKFQVNRDWNDESVHSEEPFGKGKGDSTPFDILVAQITDSVMRQINENKKKVK